MQREPLKAGEHVIELERHDAWLVTHPRCQYVLSVIGVILESDAHAPGDLVVVELPIVVGNLNPSIRSYFEALYQQQLQDFLSVNDLLSVDVKGVQVRVKITEKKTKWGTAFVQYFFETLDLDREPENSAKGKCTCTTETLMIAGCQCGGE